MTESAQPLPPARPRFKPYRTYKDSGVEWLGEIPAHWQAKRLKHLAVLNPEALPEDTDPALEMIYVDIGGVDSLGRIIAREQLTFDSAPSRARRLVQDGDVIVSTVRTYLRAIAPTSEPEPGTVVSTGFAVVRPGDDLNNDYAAYALRASYFVERIVANSKGVSFPAINESEMATYELAAPPEPEQRAIADFLDRATARIDALVAKKERLIELLQEQRTALITRAVTKGLAPSSPMKNSGVEWLAEIPGHWGVARMSELTTLLNGYPFDSEFFTRGEGIPLVRIRDLNAEETEVNYVGPIVENAWIQSGDVIIGMDGDFNVARWRGQRALLNQRMCCLRPRGDTDSGFIAYLLPLPLQVINDLTYSTTVKHLSSRDVRKVLVGAPPEPEQRAISGFLDRETSRIDTLVAKVRDAIDRLKELRTALISAAVTGRIDVREEVV
jgi:type I restriction enzyme S subunit